MYLTRIDPDTNMHRFYRLELRPDLFGGAVLVRTWGRIGCPGQYRSAWFTGPTAAEAARQDWIRRKLKRGYRPPP